MRSFLSRLKSESSRRKGELLSIAAHLCLLFFVFGGLLDGASRSAKVMPYRLPGTDKGVSLLTYYSPGSLKRVESKILTRNPDKKRPAPSRVKNSSPTRAFKMAEMPRSEAPVAPLVSAIVFGPSFKTSKTRMRTAASRIRACSS